MRAARAITAATAAGEPLPEMAPSGPDLSLHQCPHCQRRFNDKAAERHIPLCKGTKNKPTRLVAGSGRGIGTPKGKGNAVARW